MDTYTQEEAQQCLGDLVERAVSLHRHCRIISDKGTVVILPEETYENLAVTLELLSTPGLMEYVNVELEAHEVAS